MKTEHHQIPCSPETYNSFPSIAYHNGVLHLTYREAGAKSAIAAKTGSPTHHDSDSRVMYVRSIDGGAGWSTPICVFSTERGVNDPGLTITSDGRLLLRVTEIEARPTNERAKLAGPLLAHREDLGTISAVTGNFLVVSADFGKSWEKPYCMNWGLHNHAISREPITELKDGTLLLPIYESRPQAAERSYLIRSFDGGQNWTDSALIAAEPEANTSCYQGKSFNETAIISLSANRLLAIIRTDESYYTNRGGDFMTVGGIGKLHRAYSDNTGLSWSKAESTNVFGQPAALLKHQNQLFMVYAKRQKPYGIGLRSSHDEGKSWSEEKLIRSDALHWDIGYPAICSDGKFLYVTYYWQAKDAQRVIVVSKVSLEA